MERWQQPLVGVCRPFGSKGAMGSSSSAPRVPEAGAGIGPTPAFAVHAPIALGRGFFGGAALVLDFDAASFLRVFLAAGVGFGGCAEQAQGDAGAQQRSGQWAACSGGGGAGGVGHGRRGGCVAGREECDFCYILPCALRRRFTHIPYKSPKL